MVHRAGVTRLIAAVTQTPAVLVLCYHRIGDAERSNYDPDVYSATEDEFDEQVRYLKQTYGVVTLDEVLDEKARRSWRRTRVLLTFDDGYLDNYTRAYPILRSHGVQGTFFLATGLVGSGHIPWWDAICNIINTSPERLVRVPSLTPHVFDKEAPGPVPVTRQILRLYRASSDPNPSKVIADLEQSMGVPCPTHTTRRFLNWDEAREMLSGGMAIGSHSQTHPLLGGLPAEDQRREAITSRDEIRRELGVAPRVFALPCGSRSADTACILREAGYELSLSTESGINALAAWDPFHVRRVLVNRDDVKESARLRLALLTSGGRLQSLAGV